MGPKVQLLSLPGETQGNRWKTSCFLRNKISPLRSVANKGGLPVCLALVFLEWIMVWPVPMVYKTQDGTTWLEGLCLHVTPTENLLNTSLEAAWTDREEQGPRATDSPGGR